MQLNTVSQKYILSRCILHTEGPCPTEVILKHSTPGPVASTEAAATVESNVLPDQMSAVHAMYKLRGIQAESIQSFSRFYPAMDPAFAATVAADLVIPSVVPPFCVLHFCCSSHAPQAGGALLLVDTLEYAIDLFLGMRHLPAVISNHAPCISCQGTYRYHAEVADFSRERIDHPFSS